MNVFPRREAPTKVPLNDKSVLEHTRAVVSRAFSIALNAVLSLENSIRAASAAKYAATVFRLPIGNHEIAMKQGAAILAAERDNCSGHARRIDDFDPNYNARGYYAGA